MKKLFSFLLLLSFFASGCTFNVDVLTHAPPATTSVSPQLTPSTTPIALSPVATVSPTAGVSSPTPTPAGPLFYSAVFSADPSISRDGNTFGAAVKQVFVDWNYMNMSAGMKVR